MEVLDRKNLPVILIFIGVILMVFGGLILYDNHRKAVEAEAKVAELATLCDLAESDYSTNLAYASQQWESVRVEFLETRDFQLGVLYLPAENESIQVYCGGNLPSLVAGLENGDDRAPIYDTAVEVIRLVNEEISAPLDELQLAQDAKSRIETVEIYAWYTVKDHVYYPPANAVAPQLAESEFNEGMAHTTQAWRQMSLSSWRSAYSEADLALDWLENAYEHASSPTPTPLPSNTPEPTDTPEPYEPPPTSSWSSDSSTGSDSGSWDSGSDSGSWDSSGDDSGSWDGGSGSDSGSWDNSGSDSGSWKAPQMTPTPRIK